MARPRTVHNTITIMIQAGTRWLEPSDEEAEEVADDEVVGVAVDVAVCEVVVGDSI